MYSTCRHRLPHICEFLSNQAVSLRKIFVHTIVQRMNTRAVKVLVTKRAMLKPLPVRRTAEFDEIPARVSKYAVFTLKGVLYRLAQTRIGPSSNENPASFTQRGVLRGH